MAGANKMLKQGQVLFKAGDASDGMYLVRKGELQVYLEQNGKEVVLTHIVAGGMVGEMAIFDRKPRSAHVRASKESEVTLISTDDFGKLMKQIPKWFETLMTSLSERLRSTNERLQRMEAGGSSSGNPFQNTLRVLHLFNLLWHKENKKEGKEVLVERATLEKTIVATLDVVPEKLKAFIEAIVTGKLLSLKTDTYNNVCFTMPLRGVLDRFTDFLSAYSKANMKAPVLSDAAIKMLQIVGNLSKASPYDDVSVSLEDVLKEGAKLKLDTSTWKDQFKFVATAGEGVSPAKASNGAEAAKVNKKAIDSLASFHQVAAALYKVNIS